MDISKSEVNPISFILTQYDKLWSKSNGSARDGITFPSLEGALLSLAFLTFSVFLIDLVQTLLSRLRGVPIINSYGRRRKRRYALNKRSLPTSQDHLEEHLNMTYIITSNITRPNSQYY